MQVTHRHNKHWLKAISLRLRQQGQSPPQKRIMRLHNKPLQKVHAVGRFEATQTLLAQLPQLIASLVQVCATAFVINFVVEWCDVTEVAGR